MGQRLNKYCQELEAEINICISYYFIVLLLVSILQKRKLRRREIM